MLPAQIVNEMNLLQQHIFPEAPDGMKNEAVLIQSVHLLLVLVDTI